MQPRPPTPISSPIDLPVPERVESFLSADRHRPIIYLAMTSTPVDVVSGVLSALRPTGAKILIASTVHSEGVSAEGDVLVEPFLPSHKIMSRVDLAVIAGGQGSVQCAMASGIPFVGVPLQGEQDLNVHLAERLGVARMVPLRDAKGPRMAQAALALLADQRVRAAVERVRDLYAQCDGPDETARVILDYLGSHAPFTPVRTKSDASDEIAQ
jgi:UDP:flavonoid glycosyltransferase YjiC (YdhE family)